MKSLVQFILANHPLSPFGIHGVAHWARVFENGQRLVAENGADSEVVSLFGVFHDSQRFNDGSDPLHGKRGADLAKRVRGELFDLSDDRFELLHFACQHHTSHETHPNVTVQTCWDADRLDLGRVGITPDPNRLCTPAAKSSKILDWATRRGEHRYVPRQTLADWGVEIPSSEDSHSTARMLNPYGQIHID